MHCHTFHDPCFLQVCEFHVNNTFSDEWTWAWPEELWLCPILYLQLSSEPVHGSECFTKILSVLTQYNSSRLGLLLPLYNVHHASN